MIPIVAVVGHSKSGKTTLIEGLIAELKRRGRRVAAVKHAHEDFDLDRPGKDSWRFAEAGCETVAILGPQRSAVLRRHDPDYPFSEILSTVGGGADIVLVEGLSRGPYPKIETHRAELGQGLRCKGEDLLGVVTDEPLPVGCRQFAPQEISALADFLEGEKAAMAEGRTDLRINGEAVPLGSFTQSIIANTILGMVGSLKGVGAIGTVSVLICAADGATEGASTPS
ncbi:MAG: molybdopterin-guanine dinucleotide biosynthesis protein B [Planctomycetota bacterium]|jgi:molybdopterin-guanine dinucleotide biosynthesis protein B